MKEMTLEQKIGQMIMPCFRRWSDDPEYNENAEGFTKEMQAPDVLELPEKAAEFITENNIGGVILFRMNCKETEQTLQLVDQLNEAAKKSVSGMKLMIATDQEGGIVSRLQSGTKMPGNQILGAIDNENITEKTAGMMAAELASLGININFGPVVDIHSNPDHPTDGPRRFSKDPEAVARHAEAYIKGMHSKGVAATLKHFPGNGDSFIDSHIGLPCIERSPEEMEARELIPFKAGIEAGAELVMISHIQYPNLDDTTCPSLIGQDIVLPATMSKKILTDLLRNELGFSGLIVTDALEMGAIAKNFSPMDAVKNALIAGTDIILMPVNLLCPGDLEKLKKYISDVADMVRKGEIPEKRIDESIERIMHFKKTNPVILDERFAEIRKEEALRTVGCPKHREFDAKLRAEYEALKIMQQTSAFDPTEQLQ